MEENVSEQSNVEKGQSPVKTGEKDTTNSTRDAESSPLSDILKAVESLGSRYDNVEATILKLNSAVHSNSQKLITVNSTVEEMDHKMRGLEIENELMRNEIQQIKAREGLMQEKLVELQQKVNITFRKTNDVEQYTRRENLRIYGISEPGLDKDGKLIIETNEQCTQKVLTILNKHLKLPQEVKDSDIAAVHRIGKYNPNNPKARSMIVRFTSRKTRDMVFGAKKALKGLAWVITEDLTPYQYSLLSRTKNDTEICDKAWTVYGKVTMLTHSGKYVQVDTPFDLTDSVMRKQWSKNRKRNASELSPETDASSPQDKNKDENKEKSSVIDNNQEMELKNSMHNISNVSKTIEKPGSKNQVFKAPIAVENRGIPADRRTNMVNNDTTFHDILYLSDMQTPRGRKKKFRGSRGGNSRGRGQFRFSTKPPIPNRDGIYNYFQHLDSDDSESMESTASNSRDRVEVD